MSFNRARHYRRQLIETIRVLQTTCVPLSDHEEFGISPRDLLILMHLCAKNKRGLPILCFSCAPSPSSQINHGFVGKSFFRHPTSLWIRYVETSLWIRYVETNRSPQIVKERCNKACSGCNRSGIIMFRARCCCAQTTKFKTLAVFYRQ